MKEVTMNLYVGATEKEANEQLLELQKVINYNHYDIKVSEIRKGYRGYYVYLETRFVEELYYLGRSTMLVETLK